jgi:hypothetical protein
MPDRSYTTKKGINGLYMRIEFGETSVINTDTITLGGFHATTTLTKIFMCSKVDGTTIDTTNGADNIIHIDDHAAVETPCYYMVYGVKA